ncbi:MAG TPA: succinate dehydrogenase iron-sulfur subunit, partial [Candidatus Hodarchaeales archaeon]|nr:succinate dehydrogenase iron-sulfur subunit [Candidatus Hodarchaeales archaeon]
MTPVPTTVELRVKRFDPGVDKQPYYQNYNLAVNPTGETVLGLLNRIVQEQDGSLSFRSVCRAGICGSDALFINGRHLLACQTQIGALKLPVTVEPLPGYPVIKDLVVNMDPFFEKYESVKPYLIEPSDNIGEKEERIQSPKQLDKIDIFTTCILCGACFSACPIVWTDGDYLGPQALGKAFRFVEDSRDAGKTPRLRLIDSEEGPFRCHQTFECVE